MDTALATRYTAPLATLRLGDAVDIGDVYAGLANGMDARNGKARKRRNVDLLVDARSGRDPVLFCAARRRRAATCQRRMVRIVVGFAGELASR